MLGDFTVNMIILRYLGVSWWGGVWGRGGGGGEGEGGDHV